MITEVKQNNKLYLKFIDNDLGWGVFTDSFIKKGDDVEYCHCVLDNFVTSPLKDYVFSTNLNNFDVYHCLGFGAIYNHSSDPNITWELINNDNHPLFKFYALRDIEIVEELRHCYGSLYWKNKTKKII